MYQWIRKRVTAKFHTVTPAYAWTTEQTNERTDIELNRAKQSRAEQSRKRDNSYIFRRRNLFESNWERNFSYNRLCSGGIRLELFYFSVAICTFDSPYKHIRTLKHTYIYIYIQTDTKFKHTIHSSLTYNRITNVGFHVYRSPILETLYGVCILNNWPQYQNEVTITASFFSRLLQ